MSNTDTPHLRSPSRNPNSFTSKAFDWSSDELFRAAEAVEAMLASSGWEAVQRLLAEGKEFEQKYLNRVMARNQLEAAQIVGRIEGLDGAASAAQAIQRAAAEKRQQLESHAAEAAEGARG